MVSGIIFREADLKTLNLSRRLIVVNLILPFNLFFGLFFLFTQMLFLERDVSENGLSTKRFLYAPLMGLLDKENASFEPPGWLLFVAMESGEIVYTTGEHGPVRPLGIEHDGETGNENQNLAEIVKAISGTMTIISFRYNGQHGVAVYMRDLLPFHFQLIQNPAYTGFIFALTTVLFLLGLFQMNKYHRSVSELVRASARIANKDFETEITVKAEREMGTVFQAFDQMRKTLKSNRENEARFVMSVTHDLKTPLAAMRMYLEAMKDGYIEINGEARDAVQKILIKSEMLEDRIAELLEYSKLQNTVHEIQRENVNVPSWIKDQIVFFEEESQMHRRLFSSRVNLPEDLKASINQKLMSRALNNLIDNAFRYTAEGDTVAFASYYEGNSCFFEIEDSGPGIPEEEREKIFELFYRVDKGRNRRGMGIGLASVKSIIENHGGKITCGESPSGGALFRITLPVL